LTAREVEQEKKETSRKTEKERELEREKMADSALFHHKMTTDIPSRQFATMRLLNSD
jgi:hypothetical protein